MKKCLFIPLVIFYSSLLFFNPAESIAQAPELEWAKCLGGNREDIAKSVQQTADGGYVVAGYTRSEDGDVTGNHGGKDFWIVKLLANGSAQWKKAFGGDGDEEAYAIQQTSDGGYIVAGWTESDDVDDEGGDVTNNHGGKDYWVLKLDANGDTNWQKCLGGSDDDMAYAVQQTTDGGYIVAGYSESSNGDVTNTIEDNDFWIVKLGEVGNIEWQKCYGGLEKDVPHAIQQTTDGGYIVAGYTLSNYDGDNDLGDVTDNHGNEDFWVVKLNATGVIQWQKCLGGSEEEIAHAVQQTTDGGYIVTGSTTSNNGNVSGNHAETNGGGQYSEDFWMVKLTGAGDIDWQKCLGGSGDDACYSVRQTSDDGYILAGYANSEDGDVSGIHYEDDFWLVKLTKQGALEWQKCLGGTDLDYAFSVKQTTDGGFVAAGSATSNNGDVTGNFVNTDGYYDESFWVVKLASTTTATYTFIGTGNWDNAANWQNGLRPPSVINAGEIIINPSGSTECILNVPLTISLGAKLTVAPGKKFIINKNLEIRN